MFAKYYLNPTSLTYRVSSYLFSYKWLIILILGLIIFSYPTYLIMDINSKIVKEKAQFPLLLKQKLQIKDKLKQLNISTRSQSRSALELNEEIKNILIEYKVNIDMIQWNKENNTINMIFSHEFLRIKQVIEKIVKQPSIYFNEIVLTKMNKNHFIQCELSIQIL